MSKEKNEYEAGISSSYNSKELLKNTLLLGIIATAGAFFTYWIIIMIYTDGLNLNVEVPIEVLYLIFIFLYFIYIICFNIIQI